MGRRERVTPFTSYNIRRPATRKNEFIKTFFFEI